MTWDSGFLDRSPMLGPLAAGADALRASADWPDRSLLQSLITAAGVTNARGMPIRLIEPSSAKTARYESDVYERGELQVRERQWHDLFNVLAWLAYPLTKAALNARHVEALRDQVPGATDGAAWGARNRGRVQDALTVLDESGAIFAACDEDLLEDLLAFRWRQLFWTKRRRAVERIRVCVFGHAIFEKALNPYVGMTAHALPLCVPGHFLEAPPQRQLQLIDERAAAIVAEASSLSSPQALAPLPLLGVPGWWPENERESFYDNASYFRPGRRHSRGSNALR
jgi:hypothetical protein